MNKTTRRSDQHGDATPAAASRYPDNYLAHLATACLFVALGIVHARADAQAAGTGATVSVTLPSAAAPVTGWSVQHGLLGRPLMDDHDKQIGTVIDLVVTSAAGPYVLIIGVGGHFEVGGHAVALPRAAVVERKGLLHLAGASQASLKAMPSFSYEMPRKGGPLPR